MKELEQNDDLNLLIFPFLGGLVMICFALPMVWMNESRQVRTYKFIKAAESALVQNVDRWSINNVT